jgi:hypothetical protein
MILLPGSVIIIVVADCRLPYFSQVVLELWTFSQFVLEFSRREFLLMGVIWLFFSQVTLEITRRTKPGQSRRW